MSLDLLRYCGPSFAEFQSYEPIPIFSIVLLCAYGTAAASGQHRFIPKRHTVISRISLISRLFYFGTILSCSTLTQKDKRTSALMLTLNQLLFSVSIIVIAIMDCVIADFLVYWFYWRSDCSFYRPCSNESGLISNAKLLAFQHKTKWMAVVECRLFIYHILVLCFLFLHSKISVCRV